jgi:hypothetical protein
MGRKKEINITKKNHTKKRNNEADRWEWVPDTKDQKHVEVVQMLTPLLVHLYRTSEAQSVACRYALRIAYSKAAGTRFAGIHSSWRCRAIKTFAQDTFSMILSPGGKLFVLPLS